MTNNEKVDSKKEVKVEEKKKRNPLITVLLLLFLSVVIVYLFARYVGPKGFKVREYNIIDENIPTSFDGFSIVHFSDLELGTTFNIEDLDNLVESINSLNPDIVVFTGDIVKGYNNSISEEDKNILIEKLKSIDPLIGKYSVRGDDDAMSDIYDEVMRDASFKDLTNSYELIYYKGLTPIVLYGLDSILTGTPNYSDAFSYPNPKEDTTYMATYRILLAHEPDSILNVGDYNISLMLSGHSHNGEINIPYLKELYNIKGASNYFDEYYKVDNTNLYISGGLGTSKHMVRLFNKPSISIYRLYTIMNQ